MRFRKPPPSSHNHRVVFSEAEDTAYKIINIHEFTNEREQQSILREFFVLHEIARASTPLLLHLRAVYINQEQLLLAFDKHKDAGVVFNELNGVAPSI